MTGQVTRRPMLPGWPDMPDLDKGVAVAHYQDRRVHGPAIAAADHPARYREHPLLTVLDGAAASEHARQQREHIAALTDAEFVRLYRLATTPTEEKRGA